MKTKRQDISTQKGAKQRKLINEKKTKGWSETTKKAEKKGSEEETSSEQESLFPQNIFLQKDRYK